MSGLILGDWTHRRGDAGGSRAVSARILKPKPKVAWQWDLPFDGRIEQVRVAHEVVTIAATPSIVHSGWQHAEVVTLNAVTGKVIAQRRLPDPVPPSAMIVDEGAVCMVATRAGEPIFRYMVTPKSLEPIERTRLEMGSVAALDIVDAWGHSRDLWCHVETPRRDKRLFARVTHSKPTQVWLPIATGLVREPCLADGALFVPLTSAGGEEIYPCVRIRGDKVTPIGNALKPVDGAMAATLAADGSVCVIIAQPIDQDARSYEISIRVFDRESLVQRGDTRAITVFGPNAERLRLLRRPGGEMLAQLLDAQMAARSDLFVSDRQDAEKIQLSNKPYVADLALGDQLVAHRELAEGRALVVGFELDRRVLMLGRRASLRWSFETPSVGSPVALYAGAGHILVRGSRSLVAIEL